MSTPVFIGDDISACGYRLAGVRVRSPSDREQLLASLQWAKLNGNVILLSAERAAWLTASELEPWLTQLQPPLIVVPDIRTSTSAERLAQSLRAKLGVLE